MNEMSNIGVILKSDCQYLNPSRLIFDKEESIF